MNRGKQIAALLLAFAIGSFGFTVSAQRPYGGSSQQIRLTLNSLDNDFARFRASLNSALDNGDIRDGNRQDTIDRFVNEFQQSSTDFRSRVNDRRADANGVQDLLGHASDIDRFMQRNPLQPRVQRNWTLVRQDLDRLALSYSVRWDWNARNDGPGRPDGPDHRRLPGGPDGPRYASRLTGTYQLDSSRSDNAQAAVDRATRSLPRDERDRASSSLMSRLNPPDMLSIDKQGRNVTIASSKGNRITFDADGISRNEQISNGRNVQMQATLNGDQLVISTTGDRSTDFGHVRAR